MPELSRFHGIRFILRIREHEAVFDITPLRLTEGHLPARARSLVVGWAALHREELMNAWLALRAGRNPEKIAPLD